MLFHLEKMFSLGIIHVAIRYLQPFSLQSRIWNHLSNRKKNIYRFEIAVTQRSAQRGT